MSRRPDRVLPRLVAAPRGSPRLGFRMDLRFEEFTMQLDLWRRLMHAAVPGLAGTCGLVFVLLAPFLTPDRTQAQSVEDQIRALAGANAEGYLRPFSDGVGFALTGGNFDSPRARKGFSFDLGFRVLGAIPPESAREFTAILPDTVRWREQVYTNPYEPTDGSLTTPSALGEGPGLILEPAGQFRSDLMAAGENPDDFRIAFPEGLDLRAVPAAMLSLSVGVGLGTELSARFLPTVQVNSETGDVSARGWGVQHTVSRWFASPVDISIGVGRQDVEIGDLIDASASEGWVLLGRSVGPLTLFGTMGVRNASIDVEYEMENVEGVPGMPSDGTLVRFSSDLDSTTSLGAGFRLQLLFMNLSGQYTAGDYDTFSVKIGLGTP